MRPLRPLAPALSLTALALLCLSASADVVPSRDWRPPPRLHVRLASVRLQTGDAPRADQQRVRREVRAALRSRQPRLDQCLHGMVDDEDPIRRRSRVYVGRLAFDRSARATGGGVLRARGIPSGARRCIEEVTRAIALSSPPRGFVEVRYRYVLHSRRR